MVLTRTRVRLLKGAVWAAASWPLLQTGWRWFFGDRLGANPLEVMILGSGLSAVVLLIATLAVTPLRRVTGWNALQRLRRLLGLWAFAYATLHVTVYLALDQGWAWSYILEDVTERRFTIVGALAFVLLLPLAVTSTRGWVRRLGRRWVLLHRLVYPAAGLALLHYTWGQKADLRGPLIAAAVMALLFGVRFGVRRPGRRGPARTGSGGASPAAPVVGPRTLP
ncbi:MAG: protein-methionine-sulfoxide reductase heme-binding subunit MsrQ [Longimicrobiales bacterium]|nr:protein-methionine-sulfoxide reductase heme-binding subunit MsrQ [Longimicrobiales bacterium]